MLSTSLTFCVFHWSLLGHSVRFPSIPGVSAVGKEWYFVEQLTFWLLVLTWWVSFFRFRSLATSFMFIVLNEISILSTRLKLCFIFVIVNVFWIICLKRSTLLDLLWYFDKLGAPFILQKAYGSCERFIWLVFIIFFTHFNDNSRFLKYLWVHKLQR